MHLASYKVNIYLWLSPKSGYALFLGFSDLVLVDGMLPSVLQTPPPGRSKNISNTFVGVVLIAPVIIMRAALCRRSSSDLVKAVPMPSHHATAAYVISGIITRWYSHSIILGESPQVLPMYALHDHRALSPFFTCALTCAFQVSYTLYLFFF